MRAIDHFVSLYTLLMAFDSAEYIRLKINDLREQLGVGDRHATQIRVWSKDLLLITLVEL